MASTVYLESSVISLLAARPSRDVVTLGHQQITEDWWTRQRAAFELRISAFVLDEVGRGDPEAARRRLDLLRGIPILAVDERSQALAERLVRSALIPEAARIDAEHVAIATVHRIDFLATWNLKHIADARVRRRIEAACRALGYEAPVLCTPEELMGEFRP